MNKWEILKNRYINNGIKIIPIVPNQKTPMIENWNKDCSSDYFQVLYWHNQNKDMNFAIPCYENNLFVIDLDRHDPNKDGVENFGKLLKDINYPIDHYTSVGTLVQQTPSGGLHIIYQSDNDLTQVNGVANAFKDYPGIDLRNRNYIVAEPSVINDKSYKFLTNMKPQPMPQQLKDFILNNAPTKSDIKKEPYKKPTSVEVGDRDNQLFSYINNVYYKTNLDYDEVLCLANYFNENILEKPFPERVVKYKVTKIFEKERNKYIFIKINNE